MFPGTAGAATADAAGSPWRGPRCETVEGDGSVSFTRDGGQTVAPTTGVMRPVKYVMGLEALAQPNQLLSVDDRGQLARSNDAGCTWSPLASLPSTGIWSISPAAGGAAYVWNFRGDRVYRVEGQRVFEGPAFDAARLGGFVTLTADKRKPTHLRGVTQKGRVLDSRDGGRTFRPIGAAPVQIAGPDHLVYDAKIAPSRPNEIVIGISEVGALTSHNGGRTWRRTTIGRAGDRVNGFTVAMSPIDPKIVYLQALNISEMDRGGPGGGRHVYRSDDGGKSFRPVADHGGEVTITNGGLLKPSPWDPDVVFFEYGDPVYRTSLYTLNIRTHRLSIAHNPHDGIKSIAFNPTARDVMYLGFVEQS
ncbi:WD40/YVTN/BNR-like repeat-containing protein [Actinomadura harenae]|uniref:WD40/YVTN/BNR-like repeat-containing protein n=1 Tax=Actinomadura harenae TaxID=2483351 RepID=UPI00366B3F78